jgi:hypothetical protein
MMRKKSKKMKMKTSQGVYRKKYKINFLTSQHLCNMIIRLKILPKLLNTKKWYNIIAIVWAEAEGVSQTLKL